MNDGLLGDGDADTEAVGPIEEIAEGMDVTPTGLTSSLGNKVGSTPCVGGSLFDGLGVESGMEVGSPLPIAPVGVEVSSEICEGLLVSI